MRDREREFFIDNLLVRIHFIIIMIRLTGLAPWELNSFFQVRDTFNQAIDKRLMTDGSPNP